MPPSDQRVTGMPPPEGHGSRSRGENRSAAPRPRSAEAAADAFRPASPRSGPKPRCPHQPPGSPRQKSRRLLASRRPPEAGLAPWRPVPGCGGHPRAAASAARSLRAPTGRQKARAHRHLSGRRLRRCATSRPSPARTAQKPRATGRSPRPSLSPLALNPAPLKGHAPRPRAALAGSAVSASAQPKATANPPLRRNPPPFSRSGPSSVAP